MARPVTPRGPSIGSAISKGFATRASESCKPSVVNRFHPGRGTFRLTAGAILQPPEVNLLAGNPGTLTIGSNSYLAPSGGGVRQNQAASMPRSSGSDSIAPSLPRADSPRDRFGIAYLGEPKPTFTATTTLTGPRLPTRKPILNRKNSVAGWDKRYPDRLQRFYPMIAFSFKTSTLGWIATRGRSVEYRISNLESRKVTPCQHPNTRECSNAIVGRVVAVATWPWDLRHRPHRGRPARTSP